MKLETINLIGALFFIEISCIYTSLLHEPNFENEGEIYRIVIPFNEGTEIIRYDIMEGQKNGECFSYSTMHYSKEINLRGNKLVIELDENYRDESREYSICIITKENHHFFSESFVFNKKKGYLLKRFN